MRLDRIELSWFRGAAEKSILEASSKSVVVYGDTGSGKSSFVDAIEYILSNGKIEHLRHEYSNTHLRNCVRNTKTPEDKISQACIYFENENNVKAEVPKEGRIQFKSNPPNFLGIIRNWDVKRHILRQDEVSNFIHETKSKKYSVLSPLLGFQIYEDVAENINKIKNHVMEESDYEGLKGEFRTIEAEIKQVFTSFHEDEVKKIILERANKYIQIIDDETIESMSKRASLELDKISKGVEPQIKKYLVLKNIGNIKIQEKIEAMISSEEELSNIGEEYIDYKITVLENSNRILDSLDDLTADVQCPACGQVILGTEFKEHVNNELAVLKKSLEIRNQAMRNRREFMTALSNVLTQSKSEKAFVDWLALPDKTNIKDLFDKLRDVTIEDPSTRLSNYLIASLKAIIFELSSIIEEELKVEPPTTDEILEDYTFFRTALRMRDIKKLENKITRIEVLMSTLENIHDKIREKISEITIQILSDITSEIRRIWTKIHPKEPIEDIRISPSLERDKAIDICLKFYGTNQLSPRLTLSEGYRNSLGLSIFLALANREDTREHPIILDDIVSSLDREHRGIVIDILREELAERQVLLFTHDREWFGELRNRLNQRDWKFFTLQKWVSPENGIQLAPSHYTFEEAEALSQDHVKASGNATRVIMDTELPRAAEKLDLPMPYRLGVRNDYRTCTDFLNKFIPEGKSRFKIKRNGKWCLYQDAIDTWEKAKELLIAWADRASHAGSLSVCEATELINVCRNALSCFDCPNCGKKVWKLSHPKYVQCDCGQIRWTT